MITTFLLYILWALIYGILSPIRLLSDVTLDSQIASSIQTYSSYLATANSIFPVYVLLAIFGAIISIESTIFVYKGVMWIIKKIPTIN